MLEEEEVRRDVVEVAAPEDEVVSWMTRQQKLRFHLAQRGLYPPSLEAVFRWTCEAAEDYTAPLAADIVKDGLAYLCSGLSDTLPPVFRGKVDIFEGLLAGAGFATEAESCIQKLRMMQFREDAARKNSQMALEAHQGPALQAKPCSR